MLETVDKKSVSDITDNRVALPLSASDNWEMGGRLPYLHT